MSYQVRRIQAAGSSSSTTVCPFEASLDGQKVRLELGHVNNLIPSNIISAGLINTFDLSGGDTDYVKLSMTSDGKQITAVTIVVDATPVVSTLNLSMGTAPALFEHILAIVGGATGGKSIYVINKGNIIAWPKQVFLEAKTPSVAGGEPFNRWWSWEVFQYC